MQLVVVRHIPFEDLGHIGPLLRNRGHQITYRDIGESIDVSTTRALILMGGPMSANDPDPWVEHELTAIRQAVDAHVPVLGVCLGSQIIAKALGQPVTRNPVKEIGWYPIYWRAEAASDPLFHGFTEPEPVFHWHGETFRLPDGAVWLASSDRCAHQAFRYRDNVYGLQFHAEVTPAMIADWCQQDANRRDVRELDAPIAPNLHAARLEQLAGLVFGRWATTFL